MRGAQVGSFTIVGPLDESSRGWTYLAEHTVLKTRRAVKLLAPERMQDALAVRRFLNEARVAAQLHHRNLIGVHDVGQLENGTWFLVLDYLHGRSLGQLMAPHTEPMSAELIVHIVAQVANGLQVAHEHKIVHRDLTPEHVFLIQREEDPYHVVLLEVGTAQLGDAPSGTAAYLAPEQLGDGKVSAAADVFALGVIAYQMTTGGWFPYQYDESRAGYGELPRAELYRRQLSAPPVDPRERCRDAPRAWAETLLAAVSADPAQRPASVRALALRLAEALPPLAGSPGGLAIVRAWAHELIDTGAEDIDAVRTPRAAVLAAASAAAVRVLPALADIGSRYRLGARLGAGGMAEVFSATMTGAEGFARRVAIKRVQSGLSRVPAFAAMFIAEARIASRLSHPNIVSVLDFARDTDDRLYLVMEYVDGKDLASLLATGPISPALAMFVIVELLRALGYAHDAELGEPADPGDPREIAAGAGPGGAGRPPGRVRGVVHRDVSPQNLLISYEGEVKMSDFGLAKVRAASGHVRSDVVRGKPSYMSPEQVSGEPLDGRSDLYAAGVMLWEMLADRPLFSGTAKEITAQVMFRDIARPSQFRPVPGDLEAVAMTLLAHDRADRYPTARAAIDALLACAGAPRDGRGELARLLAARFRAAAARSAVPRSARAQQVTVAAPPSAPAVRSATERVPRPRVRRRTATLGALALAGIAAVVLARGETSPPPTAALRPAAAATRAVTAIALDAGPEAGLDAGIGARIEGGIDAGIDAGLGAGIEGGIEARIEARIDAGLEPSLEAASEPAPAHAADATPAHPAPHRERAVRTGELAIIVRPWAVIWLNGKPSGQTPFRSAVPAGRYRVRLANDNVGRDETTTVTVEPDRTSTVERSW